MSRETGIYPLSPAVQELPLGLSFCSFSAALSPWIGVIEAISGYWYSYRDHARLEYWLFLLYVVLSMYSVKE